ncbi:hypothetical protein TKK_0017952 [Trichogramma kaykai]|uniref:Septin n=1 Tax=Trichogramma kaykai TaxID=54128 RepID=A0ABD2W0N4_9HYME
MVNTVRSTSGARLVADSSFVDETTSIDVSSIDTIPDYDDVVSTMSFGSVKPRPATRRADRPIRELTLPGHVGLASLPEQFMKSVTRNGFVFNLLCVGETGLGKSTLVDCLFNTGYEYRPRMHHSSAVKLETNSYDLCESNVHLKLTVVSTIGYGDQINREDNFRPIVEYIDAQFEAHAREESGESRLRAVGAYHDARVHACLYFLCPTGHGLKSIDVACMKVLGTKCNVIPIIAKADTIAKKELQEFKNRILRDIEANELKVYQFPTDDESVAGINALTNMHQPFAIIASKDFVRVGNRSVRGREYPWGVVQMENEQHCDFVKLREMLVRTNMNDLCETTHTRHYSLFKHERFQRLVKDIERIREENDESNDSDRSFASFQKTEAGQRLTSKISKVNNRLKVAELEIKRKYALLQQGQQELADKLSKQKSNLIYEIEVFHTLKNRLAKAQIIKEEPAKRNKLSCFPSTDGDSG